MPNTRSAGQPEKTVNLTTIPEGPFSELSDELKKHVNGLRQELLKRKDGLKRASDLWKVEGVIRLDTDSKNVLKPLQIKKSDLSIQSTRKEDFVTTGLLGCDTCKYVCSKKGNPTHTKDKCDERVNVLTAYSQVEFPLTPDMTRSGQKLSVKELKVIMKDYNHLMDTDESFRESFKRVKVLTKTNIEKYTTQYLVCVYCPDDLISLANAQRHEEEQCRGRPEDAELTALVEKYNENAGDMDLQSSELEQTLLEEKAWKIVYCLIDGREDCSKLIGLPARPSVFYIGYGDEDRPSQHFRTIEEENKKNAKIREIWAEKSAVITVKIGKFKLYEASRQEALLINCFKAQLTNKQLPPLKNFGLDKWSKEDRQLLAVSLLKKLLEKKADLKSVGESRSTNNFIKLSEPTLNVLNDLPGPEMNQSEDMEDLVDETAKLSITAASSSKKK